MMKKQILAVSVAAALGAAGGAAFAAPVLKANGVGHVNIVPYFNTQNNNVTQFHIINTDTARGKAVKVRFRGAEWSDDLFDFTVFLSPGDMFAGAVRGNATTGGAEFVYGTPADGSCTLPASLTGDNAQFSTVRVGSSGQAGTREGYIEIINMADIIDDSTTTTDLFSVIKHVSGVAPCSTAGSAGANLLAALTEDASTAFDGVAATNHQTSSMAAPTGTLTTWSRIIDTVNVKSYNNTATAIAFQTSATDATSTTQKAYFKQSNDARTPTLDMTADGIFFQDTTANTMRTQVGTPITPMYQYDMPDLSTPIDTDAPAGTDATLSVGHRDAVAALLAKDVVVSEFITAADVGGSTDLVINQPVRRYFYTYQKPDATQAAQAEGTGWSRLVDTAKYRVTGHAGTAYSPLTLTNRIPLDNLATAYVPSGFGGPALFMGRDEQYSGSNIVVSPTPPTAGLSLKGELTVLSVGLGSTATQSTATDAKLTWADVSVPGGHTRGWVTLSTKSSAGQLPVIGYTALRVAGGNQYGNAVPFRYFGSAGAIGH